MEQGTTAVSLKAQMASSLCRKDKTLSLPFSTKWCIDTEEKEEWNIVKWNEVKGGESGAEMIEYDDSHSPDSISQDLWLSLPTWHMH